MLKKIYTLFLLLAAFLILAQPIKAQETNVALHFFYGAGCPHCTEEREFLATLTKQYSNLTIQSHEIYKNSNNAKLMYEVGQTLDIRRAGVPLTVIGKEYMVGYAEGLTDQKIINVLENLKTNQNAGYEDIIEKTKQNLLAKSNKKMEVQPSLTPPKIAVSTAHAENNNSLENLKVPILGKINIKSFSLPVLTIILAVLDGFNPCAIWTLLFLINLLIGMKDKKRMWLLGITFVVSSAAVYFVFLTAWLNLFLFLGFIFWIRLIVGLLALGAGGYYLYDFFINKASGCKVVNADKRQKFFDKVRQIIGKKQLIAAILGMIVLAAAVNLIELVCSAGLPAIYTQILSLSNLPSWQYYLYLILYVLIFMLDDLFIFFTMMITLQATGIQNKYARASRLIGGFLMLIIGILLIFKPEALMFG